MATLVTSQQGWVEALITSRPVNCIQIARNKFDLMIQRKTFLGWGGGRRFLCFPNGFLWYSWALKLWLWFVSWINVIRIFFFKLKGITFKRTHLAVLIHYEASQWVSFCTFSGERELEKRIGNYLGNGNRPVAIITTLTSTIHSVMYHQPFIEECVNWITPLLIPNCH